MLIDLALIGQLSSDIWVRVFAEELQASDEKADLISKTGYFNYLSHNIIAGRDRNERMRSEQ
jgi:hypothetical protein